jgi:hypothetical protein
VGAGAGRRVLGRHLLNQRPNQSAED